MTLQMPVIVSFAAGDDYYHEAAEHLAADCKRLGLPADIETLDLPTDFEWPQICRQKIPFLARMLEKHPCGILWVDVDSRILRAPAFCAAGGYDFGVYLRDFQSLPTFDAALVSRTFMPGYMHFGGTEKARAFLDGMVKMERERDLPATDDYFLHEAWLQFGHQLSVNLFPAHSIVRDADDVDDRTCFVNGASGRTPEFRGKVYQHEVAALSNERRRRVLKACVREALDARQRGDAIVFQNKIVALDPNDKAEAERLADLHFRSGEARKAMGVLKSAFGARIDQSKSRRLFVEAALALGQHDRAERVLRQIEEDKTPEEAAFAASRRAALLREQRAVELGLAPEDRPAIWWIEAPYPGNFGDVLNPYLIERLSGRPVRRVPRGDGVLAIGSVAKFARKGTTVWGAGTPRMTDTLSADADWRAVRGPLTAELVHRSGGSAPDVFGDPALLLPLVYAPIVEKRYQLGLIRHHVHADIPLILGDGVVEIDVRTVGDAGIEAFIAQVLSCEAIMSTSLHGLIVPHAYGVPSLWCTFSDAAEQISGDFTKFHDHHAVVRILRSKPFDLSGVAQLEAAHADLCSDVVPRQFEPRRLLSVAPFALLPEIANAAGL